LRADSVYYWVVSTEDCTFQEDGVVASNGVQLRINVPRPCGAGSVGCQDLIDLVEQADQRDLDECDILRLGEHDVDVGNVITKGDTTSWVNNADAVTSIRLRSNTIESEQATGASDGGVTESGDFKVVSGSSGQVAWRNILEQTVVGDLAGDQ